MKIDIANRNDINVLVRSFYGKVLKNDTLAPFFSHIKNWDEHFEQLTNFWESSLFLNTKYYGNPLEAHLKVDQLYDHQITEYHFGIWLNLWYQTIDDLFEGEIANRAKSRARKMSTFLHLKIFEARQS